MKIKIYFRTITAAIGFRVALTGSRVTVSQPKMTTPAREGRGVVVEVTAMGQPQFAGRYADGRFQAWLVSQARRYDGIIIDTQNNQEIP